MRGSTFALGFVALSILVPVHAMAAQTFAVVHTFQRPNDGAIPQSGLVRDRTGNLYGTTSTGGAYGKGTIFTIAPHGAESVLHSFSGGSDGWEPIGRLLADRNGNLFGTTLSGGNANCVAGSCSGTVFKLAPDGTEKVLHVFTGGTGDGANPHAGLIMDRAGNLFGTTQYGGGTGCEQGFGCGTVFRIAPDGTETLLHVFAGDDGAYPMGSLLADKSGNLYGTTLMGGTNDCGTVFKLASDGTHTLLHSFSCPDGGEPAASLIMDTVGNLYGTTQSGGGTVFKIAADGTVTVLHAFAPPKDGDRPIGGLTVDGQGNLYGTTYFGAGTGCWSHSGCGAIFKLAPDGTEEILHRFTGSDGANSDSTLILDHTGFLYGTATRGGPTDGGTVFRIRK